MTGTGKNKLVLHVICMKIQSVTLGAKFLHLLGGASQNLFGASNSRIMVYLARSLLNISTESSVQGNPIAILFRHGETLNESFAYIASITQKVQKTKNTQIYNKLMV